MRYPYEIYLKYLLLTRETGELYNTLQKNDLKQPTEQELCELWLRMEPVPESLSLKKKTAQNFLKTQRVYSLFIPGYYISDIYEILSQPDIRKFIQAAILSGLDSGVICAKLDSKFGILFEQKTIEYYQHVFWNRDLLNNGEWKEFLRTVPDMDETLYSGCMHSGEIYFTYAFNLLEVPNQVQLLEASIKRLGLRMLDLDSRKTNRATVEMLCDVINTMTKVADQLEPVESKISEFLERLMMIGHLERSPSKEEIGGEYSSPDNIRQLKPGVSNGNK